MSDDAEVVGEPRDVEADPLLVVGDDVLGPAGLRDELELAEPQLLDVVRALGSLPVSLGAPDIGERT
jgi:hypothetical protein